MNAPHRLLVFMTPGTGLADWRRVGAIERELKPYREYLRRGWAVTLAASDRPGNRFDEAAGMSIRHAPPERLLFALGWALMRRAIRAADVIKTNQSVNAWWFVLAARVCRRPIALRCGYVFGEYLETTQGRDAACRWYQVREGWAFRHATACIVPTDTLKSWVCRRYRVPAERVHTVPNFVDTDAFARTPGSVPRSRSVIHVGTISPVKNPELLVRACAKAGAELLTFVGDGPDAAKVQRLAAELGVPAVIAGRMPHAQLPAILRSHAVYVQPSLREGHCKSLTEAMACGLACVGTEVPGIVDSIRHEQTGLLCRLDADALGSAIRRLFDDDALRRRLGENAAAVVRAQYAFQPVFDREFSVMSSLVKDPSRVHAP